MRKTSIDIPAYIAEACGKANDVDVAKTINAALGFANRLEYYALMARDLEFLEIDKHKDYEVDLIEVKKMMNGFNRRLAAHLP
jgi:four helix bundle protein